MNLFLSLRNYEQEILRVGMGCWSFVCNGKSGIRSHAGAWELGRRNADNVERRLYGYKGCNIT